MKSTSLEIGPPGSCVCRLLPGWGGDDQALVGGKGLQDANVLKQQQAPTPVSTEALAKPWVVCTGVSDLEV